MDTFVGNCGVVWPQGSVSSEGSGAGAGAYIWHIWGAASYADGTSSTSTAVTWSCTMKALKVEINSFFCWQIFMIFLLEILKSAVKTEICLRSVLLSVFSLAKGWSECSVQVWCNRRGFKKKKRVRDVYVIDVNITSKAALQNKLKGL